LNDSICLIALPSPFLIEDKCNPPLGLLCVSAALKVQGEEQVIVHDGPVDKIPDNYSVYGISATTPQFPMAVEAMKSLRSRNPVSRFIIGGPHATVDPESCLKVGFDNVVMGEGEIGAGVALKYQTKIVWARPSVPIFPDRDAIDINSYTFKVNDIPATTLMSSRGCPYHCGFCCKTSDKARLYPAEFVNKEISLLHDKYGFKALMFFDDIFILDRSRTEAILPTLKAKGITWRGFARADLIVKHGPEFAQKLKDSGCHEIGIGVESGSDRILEIIKKGESVDTIKWGISILKETGIRVKGFFIVGLPGENHRTIQETDYFIRQSGLDDLDVSLFQPYRGSPIYQNKQDYDINWNELELSNSWYKGTPGSYRSQVWTRALSPDDLVEYRDELEKTHKRWN
jgi:anaerobic magnesium-protoporphyrin IX monomethyl ester cyclase